MIPSRDDLKRLRVPVVLCLMLISAGVGALVAAEHAMDLVQTNKKTANLSKLAAQDRVAKATEEEREIRENIVQFQQLVSWGMIGEEKRLDWVETIAQIRQQRKLFRINYDIEAQKVLDYPGVMPAGGVEFMSSRLKIDLPLLHEEDLLNFLSDLRAARKAYVSPRRCVIDRSEREAPPGGRGMSPRLKADCQLDMITIREKVAK